MKKREEFLGQIWDKTTEKNRFSVKILKIVSTP